MDRENNIIFDAYYLIGKFQNGISNLKLQKMMYFFEAYYMNVHEECTELYECNFSAWNFGPVAIPLYKEFRRFGNNRIVLNEDEIEKGKSISEEKKKMLDYIYLIFKDVSPMKLVELTHMKYSPWYNVWEKNGRKVGYGADTYINKLESKRWFKEQFITSE